jgi:uncharacterized protein (TIGR02266 family)
MTDKPRAARIPVDVEIDIHSESNFFTGFAANISSGGLFVATHTPAKIGERVVVKFALPSHPEEMEAEGIVRWIRDFNPLHPDIHPGMGLQFVDLPPEVQSATEQFLNEREPLFHPEDD